MVYLATESFFENMLELKHFGLYFERIQNKNTYFHIEIMISAADICL